MKELTSPKLQHLRWSAYENRAKCTVGRKGLQLDALEEAKGKEGRRGDGDKRKERKLPVPFHERTYIFGGRRPRQPGATDLLTC